MDTSDHEASKGNPDNESLKVPRWTVVVGAAALVLTPPVWLMLQTRSEANDVKSAASTPAPVAARKPESSEYDRKLALAVKLLNQRKAQESLEPLERCNQLSPNNSAVFNNFCVAYGLLERGEEAVRACNRALELNPANYLAKNNLGWVSSIKPKVAQQ